MSDIDLAVSRSKRLEQLLEQKLGATGKGLHQKVSSVEADLPAELVQKLRFVATIRNKIIHEDDYKKMDDRPRFIQYSKEAERQLKSLGGGRSWKPVLLVIVVVIVLALIALWKMGFGH